MGSEKKKSENPMTNLKKAQTLMKVLKTKPGQIAAKVALKTLVKKYVKAVKKK